MSGEKKHTDLEGLTGIPEFDFIEGAPCCCFYYWKFKGPISWYCPTHGDLERGRNVVYDVRRDVCRP